MKRLRYAAIGFLVGLACLSGEVAQAVTPTILLGYGTPAGNNSNPHNLSSRSSNTIEASTETQICIFCHTPHGAATQSQLWSRKDPTRMGQFPLYNSATLIINDAGIRDTTQYKLNGVDGVEYPNGATKLCLSCHDGATAIGELITETTIAMTQNTITNAAKIFDPTLSPPNTEDFSKTHPVSFVYTAAVKNYINANGKSGYKLPDEGATANPLVALDGQKRMQCTTCHNPHQNTRGTPAGYDLPFWASYTGTESTDYDATCNACHDSPPVAFPPGGGHGLP